MEYIPGRFESIKFASKRPSYEAGLNAILNLQHPPEDLIHHFPAFVGHMTLARFLALYEIYKMTLGVSGHIAELGVYKGSGTLFFAKLVEIFESGSLTQVHGFDWFKGNEPSAEEPNIPIGSYYEEISRVQSLVSLQNLDHVIRLHNLDLTKDLPDFFSENSHLQFKIVFADAGMYDVVKSSIENFWPRITPGGILILDQFNFDLAPGETRAVNELLPNAKVKTFPWSWMPTAHIIKE